jgi:geranylgeranyl pyrophosphate synthase
MQGMLTACYDITNGNLGFDISTMLECRCSIRRPKLRPFIAAVCAGASGGTNFKTHEKRIGAAVELLNLSTYYANIAFDGKRNCKDKNEVTMFCLAAMLLRDSVFEYLAKHGLSSISALRVIAVLSKGYLDVSKGQVLDICQLSGFNGRVLPTPDDHLRLYIRRCALLGGGSLMSVCLAGGLTGGMDEGSLVKMARYGWWHGTALQIINDISDFAPVYAAGKSVGKTENDRYADLLACKLTLPNFHLCKEICGDICDFKKMKDFICHELQADNQQKLSRIFSESLLLAEEADVLAAESIRTLPSGIRQILAASLIVSKKNKFYTQLQCRIDDNMLCVEASARMRKALLDCPSNTIPGDDHFEEQILCLSNQKTNFGKL